MKHPFIVIEGLDGSGKATQTNQLCKALKQKQIKYRHLTFPDYEQDSSALIKLYLSGAFGTEPNSVNAYAAASFYAVDRYASFQRFWKQDYLDGTCLVADRYATSNFIYQLTKLPKEEWEHFIHWAEDYEYHKLELPRPDVVIYLDVPPEISQALLSTRYQGDETKKDIHERDAAYLEKSHANACSIAEKYGWKEIKCTDGDRLKTIDEIGEEVYKLVRNII